MKLDLNALWEQIAKTFGTTVEQAQPYLEKYYELVTREIVAKGVMNIVWATLSFIALVVFIILMVKSIKANAEYSDGEEYFYLIPIAIFLFAFACELDLGVRRLINPEYHAIQQIAEDIGLKDDGE